MQKKRALLIDSRQRNPYLRPYLREWFRDSLTIIPLLFLVGAILLFLLMRWIDSAFVSNMAFAVNREGQVDAAISISSVIAISMLSFVGVIFSIALVALQLANQQLSPNIVRKFEGSNTVKFAMGFFIATFVYALLLLREASAAGPGKTQWASVNVALVLVVASVLVFVVFVREILQMLRIAKVIGTIVNDTHRAIDDNFPREGAYIMAALPPGGEPAQIVAYLDPPTSLLVNHAPQGTLKAINDIHLLRLAREQGCYLRILFQIGDHVMRGDPIVEVYGSNADISQEILAQFVVGEERNLFQDPAFGFRQLVDIASHSLSTGVLLPSIAGMVIDNLTELLLHIARRPEPTGWYADDGGQIRLQRPLRAWADYVNLAYNDIRHYGAVHPLIQHRLRVAFERLLRDVPEDYRPPVEHQYALLEAGRDLST